MANGKPVDGGDAPVLGDSLVHSDAGRRLGPYSTLAPILAILSCVLYSCNGELLQFLQQHATNGGHASPMLNLILCHLGGLVFVPQYLLWKPSGCNESSYMNVKMGSLILTFLLMGYNYAWLQSARFLTAGLTNAIFQTSVAFVYIAGIVVFKEKVESVQLFGCVLALCGSFLASGFHNSGVSLSVSLHTGVFLALCAAGGMMMYQVVFKYMYGQFKHDARFLAHIGAWVSVWHIIIILPLAFVAHATGLEPMQLPHGHLAVGGTLLSACIASAVNAMYLCLVMWGSLMMLPCASALSVPFTVALDMFLHHNIPAKLEVCGDLLVVLSVVMIMGLHKAVLSSMKGKLHRGEHLPSQAA